LKAEIKTKKQEIEKFLAFETYLKIKGRYSSILGLLMQAS